MSPVFVRTCFVCQDAAKNGADFRVPWQQLHTYSIQNHNTDSGKNLGIWEIYFHLKVLEPSPGLAFDENDEVISEQLSASNGLLFCSWQQQFLCQWYFAYLVHIYKYANYIELFWFPSSDVSSCTVIMCFYCAPNPHPLRQLHCLWPFYLIEKKATVKCLRRAAREHVGHDSKSCWCH